MSTSINKKTPGIHNKKPIISSLALAVALAGFSLTVQAGKIISVPSATGAEGFGGWNLNNIEVILNGTQGAIGDNDTSWFDESNGAYNFANDSNFSYAGNVDDGTGTVMGIALAKDWPVGEPSGIKIVNDDALVKAPKPPNCIMATSYLADHYLDSDDPQQVLCSGPFQSHKRYKLAMLPSSVDGVGSDAIDLVFNVEAEAGSREYQIFQKINNWTDGRLEGFRVQVGVGVGAGFQTASAAGADLTISVPTEIWAADQLAVFSADLFGPLDNHTGNTGFFDPDQRAGFLIDEYGSTVLTDTLTATTTLGSNYAKVPAGASDQFGPWIANNMLPYGIFFDDNGNPETEPQLLAWYGFNPALGVGALDWMGGADSNFAEITAAEFEAMAANLAYTMDFIDDLVNVGLSYIVTVGDVNTFAGSTFTIRVIPTKDTSGAGD
ncbi:MAG: choice-of-anchor F family protein, partial [Gammaproteobacteria bacterium]|nr:choice-of-anchor F family protein [Gammaproteobacteria bacterium]